MAGIYKHSQFAADLHGHGGNKRAAQIIQLLDDANIKYLDLDIATEQKNRSLSSLIRGLRYSKNLRIGLKNNYAIGRYLNIFEEIIALTKPSFFIWESTVTYNLLLAEILNSHNIPFVALPHNLESLITGSYSIVSKIKSPGWLLEESHYLRKSLETFTISREEQWLLSLHDVKATYLPYYPPEQLKEHLLSVRQRKLQFERTIGSVEVLLLGTFHNKPTRDGYIEVLKSLKKYPDIVVNVAGYGSEQLTDLYDSRSIKIWGSVTVEQLTQLIIKCQYAIIHQEPTTGALTKIPELIIAGIPILANVFAGRSFIGVKGVSIYNDFHELLELIHSNGFDMPPLLERPTEEQNFISIIKNSVS